MMTMRTTTRATLLACTLLVTAMSAPAAVRAQNAASLDRVDELTRLGRPEEARALLVSWWDGDSDRASRRELERGLWLRARLTVDPVQAELDFRRLVVLYPRGAHTPDALMRLAQGAFEAGDAEEARDYVQTLSRDFPGSPVARDAEAWLRSAGPAPAPPVARAAERPRPAAREPSTERDGASQTATPPKAATAPETTPSRPVAATSEPPRAEPGGNYFVQLGAFAERERAVALFEEARGAGIDVRIVRVDGSRFLHVRFGRFVEREDAVAELERLSASGISAALVRDERGEQLVQGG